MHNAWKVGGIAAAALLMAPPAEAYIDPGMGSLLLQSLIGGLAAAALMLRVFWSRLKTLVSPKQREDHHSR